MNISTLNTLTYYNSGRCKWRQFPTSNIILRISICIWWIVCYINSVLCKYFTVSRGIPCKGRIIVRAIICDRIPINLIIRIKGSLSCPNICFCTCTSCIIHCEIYCLSLYTIHRKIKPGCSSMCSGTNIKFSIKRNSISICNKIFSIATFKRNIKRAFKCYLGITSVCV